MTGVSESRRLRLLSVALGTLVVIAFAVTSKAGARAFPEASPSQTFAAAGTSASAPQVSLTVAGAVGKAEPISASATALAPLASIGIGYCPGWTCSAAFASEISSAPGGVLKTLWSGLPPDGTYTLVAYAVTADGVGGESTPVTVTVDSTPPDTSIASAPSSTDPVDTATFQLASNEPGATFQCKIDTTSIWTDCSSPVVVFGVAAGSHRLTVRAVDAAGNVDPTPATATWKANAPSAPPETTTTNGPDALVNTRNQTIQFTSNNPLATFECAVDSVTFVACLSPRPVLNRPDGPHVFRVRAVVGGVADPTPAEVSWTIDATAPTVTISPSRVADGKGFYGHSVTFTTSGTDAGGTVTCSAPQTYNGPDVSHLAIVGSCTDAAGNTKSATFDLRYDTTAPAVRVAFRVRDRNGWYNRAFNITWLGTDNTGGSGGVTCTPVQHYAGPDTASGSLSGSCSDAVGNTASGTFPFAYDDTDPA